MFTNNYYNSINGAPTVYAYSGGNYGFKITAPTGQGFTTTDNYGTPQPDTLFSAYSSTASGVASEVGSFVTSLTLSGARQGIYRKVPTSANVGSLIMLVGLLNSPIYSSMYELMANPLDDGYITANRTNGAYVVTISNSGSQNIEFNTIELAVRVGVGYSTGTSSSATKDLLLAAWQFPTVTLAPGESKTYAIKHDQYQEV